MPAARTNNDVMLLIGQLLEAAQAASDGLKSTNLEIQANGKALIAAVKTLELIEETVAELDRVVRTGNGDSIITRLAMLRAEVTDLQGQVGTLETRVHTLHDDISGFNADRQQVAGGKKVIWGVLRAVGWALTTLLAAWAAYGQWLGAQK